MSLGRTGTVAALLLLALAGCSKVSASTFGPHCRIDRRCNGLVGIDCNSASDGPYYFVRESDGEMVARCGGACMRRVCEDCPPKEWTCTP